MSFQAVEKVFRLVFRQAGDTAGGNGRKGHGALPPALAKQAPAVAEESSDTTEGRTETRRHVHTPSYSAEVCAALADQGRLGGLRTALLPPPISERTLQVQLNLRLLFADQRQARSGRYERLAWFARARMRAGKSRGEPCGRSAML